MKILKKFKSTLNTGFDEILLLDIFKDLISIKLEESNKKVFMKGLYSLNFKEDNIEDIEKLEKIKKCKSMIIADNKKIFTLDNLKEDESLSLYLFRIKQFLQSEEVKSSKIDLILYLFRIYKFLQSEGVLNSKIHLTLSNMKSISTISDISFKPNDMLYLIDSILKNIIYTESFNIKFGDNYLSELLNEPYLRKYDNLYDCFNLDGINKTKYILIKKN